VKRGWPLLLAGVVVTLLAVTLLGEAFGREPTGPVSSSYATNAEGLAAWAQLLRNEGRTVVQLRTALTHARLDPRGTVVVLDPSALLHSEGERLLRFVAQGGRLVIGGREPQEILPALLGAPPRWAARGEARLYPAKSTATSVAGVGELAGASEGEWTESRGYAAPLRGARGDGLLLERTLGAGTLALVADASPLQNRLLASADNAQFALDLSGRGRQPVVFVESLHGYGPSRGLAAVPARWWVAFACLLLAGLLWAIARGRRLGVAEPAEEQASPARADYVHAISLLLRRGGEERELSAALVRLRDRR
jgi:Domain of unknown function (DUF4350)